MVMFSIKVVDEEKHEKLTTTDNKEILKNLKLAVDSDVELVISYVLIPNVNDSAEDLQDLIDLVKSFDREIPVQLLRYHKMGTAKWQEMGLCDPLADVSPATPEEVKSFQEQLTADGIQIH
jgi:pyruvate formate lyase activating enzyme